MTVPLSILPRPQGKKKNGPQQSQSYILHAELFQNHNRKRFQNFWFKMNPSLETNNKFLMQNIKAHSFVHSFSSQSSQSMQDCKQKQTRDTPPPQIYNDTTKRTVATTVTLTVVCLPLFRNKRSVVNFTEISFTF